MSGWVIGKRKRSALKKRAARTDLVRETNRKTFTDHLTGLDRAGEFKKLWTLYKSTPPYELIDATLQIGDREHMLIDAVRFWWSVGDILPNDLRAEIVDELNQRMPPYYHDSGHREPDQSYWEQRIWTYAQAARAMNRFLALRAVANAGRRPAG
jgi:hypothetical protein